MKKTSDPDGRRKYKVVALGGTFDHFHKGHRALLDEGFRRGETVLIGIVSDQLAKLLGKAPDYNYVERRNIVESYLKKKYPDRKWKIFPLFDPYGPFGDDPSVDAIVVTPESLPRAESGNEERPKTCSYIDGSTCTCRGWCQNLFNEDKEKRNRRRRTPDQVRTDLPRTPFNPGYSWFSEQRR